MQRALRQAGFSPGEINGVLTDRTRLALRSYQRKNKLAIAGVTRETLDHLGVHVPPSADTKPGQGGKPSGEEYPVDPVQTVNSDKPSDEPQTGNAKPGPTYQAGQDQRPSTTGTPKPSYQAQKPTTSTGDAKPGPVYQETPVYQGGQAQRPPTTGIPRPSYQVQRPTTSTGDAKPGPVYQETPVYQGGQAQRPPTTGIPRPSYQVQRPTASTGDAKPGPVYQVGPTYETTPMTRPPLIDVGPDLPQYQRPVYEAQPVQPVPALRPPTYEPVQQKPTYEAQPTVPDQQPVAPVYEARPAPKEPAAPRPPVYTEIAPAEPQPTPSTLRPTYEAVGAVDQPSPAPLPVQPDPAPEANESAELPEIVQRIDAVGKLIKAVPQNELVKLIQAALLDAGYDPGPIDGLMGRGTRDALREFQRDNGLPSELTIEALIVLGIDRRGPSQIAEPAPQKATVERPKTTVVQAQPMPKPPPPPPPPTPTAVATPIATPAMLPNLTNHCLPGQASSEDMPRWSQIVASNRGFYTGFTTPGGQSFPGTEVVGVPDLDNPMSAFTVDQSLQNIMSLTTNLIDLLQHPGQLLADEEKLGMGICRSDGNIFSIRKEDITYCQYVGYCTGATPVDPDDPAAPDPSSDGQWNKFIWFPGGLDFFHELDDFVNGAYPQDQPFITPVDLNGGESPEERKKWSLKLVQLLDWWNDPNQGAVGQAIDALEVIKKKVGNFRSWWNNFSNSVDRYSEGYHLGAFNPMRPDLHMCVGYFGHQTRADFLNLLNGNITLGAKYGSENISKDARAQVRTGGMSLSAFGATIDLLPTPEANIQYDGMMSWNCDRPFGVDVNVCPANFTTPAPLQQTCSGANYLSFDNAGEPDMTGLSSGPNPNPDGSFSLGVLKDYSPVHFGNDPLWPRGIDQSVASGGSGPDDPMEDELPSSAYMSAGLNLGYDFELKDPAPRPLKSIPAGPIQAILKWNLQYGMKWVHDSNLIMEDVRNAMIGTGSGIDVSTVFQRDMHAMQADDLTADNGHEIYVSPDLLLGLGYTFQKKSFGFNLTVDLGLHVDVEPSFYGGMADMNVAMKNALLQVNANEGLTCDPVYAEKAELAAVSCTADNFVHQNVPLQSAWQAIADGDPLDAQTDLLYYCGGAAPVAEGAVPHDQQALRQCQSYGFCVLEGSLPEHNLTEAVCTQVGGTFYPYACHSIYKTDIVGWTGPGCSPLLDGTGFPTAPGGMCNEPIQAFEAIRDEKLPATGGNSGGSGGTGVFQNQMRGALSVGQQCGQGFSCVEGACLSSCSADADCEGGFTCDGGACVHPGGLPFVEQIAWQAEHPEPDEPLHSVWSHAADKLEAKVDWSLGFDFRAWFKFFGKEFEIEELWSKYWNLANAGKFKYELGLSADYHSSCSADVGKVTRHQGPSTTPEILTRANWVNSGVTTSQELVDLCLAGLPVTDDADMPGLPTEDSIGNDVADFADFATEMSNNVWDIYKTEMCINGQPWESWYANADKEGFAVAAGGQTVGVIGGVSGAGGGLVQAIAEESGCLSVSRPFAGSIADPDVAGSADGQVNIYAHLIDPEGDISADNLPAPIAGHATFPAWEAAVQACMTDYVDSGNVTLAFDPEPCSGSDGVLVDLSGPNGAVGNGDTGSIVDGEVEQDR